MRLYPSTAERITLPFLTDESSVAINGKEAIAAMLHNGRRDGLRVPEGCPTFTIHPLSPRDSHLVRLKANINAPRGFQAGHAVSAFELEHRQWVENGSTGPEPTIDEDEFVYYAAWNTSYSYAVASAGLVSVAGVEGCDGPPSEYIDRLPWDAVIEIAKAVDAASEVSPLGKASSGSPLRAATPITSTSGTARPASGMASAQPEATAAAPSSAPCSTATPTPLPACLGAQSTMVPSSDLTTAFT